jgi:hypothetical protein
VEFNSLASPAFAEFVQVLRPDFVVPSRHVLGRIRDAVENEVMEAVAQLIAQAKTITLAFDGWTNHHHTQTLAIAALSPQFGCLLLNLQKTGREVWGEALKGVIGTVEAMGGKVVATIADNAANAQRVVSEAPGLSLNCLAHVANLLFEDLVKVFQVQFDQVKEVEQLFRGVMIIILECFFCIICLSPVRSRARSLYDEEKINIPNACLLVEPGDTRWGS